MSTRPTRVALYSRVSTTDETVENQLLELRRLADLRGWTVFREYNDEGVSGAKDRRPALDQLVADAKRRRFDTVCCWKLDRLGRNLRHLVLMLDEFQALGIGFVTLGEGIDTSTPAGRLQTALLGAVAAFERERIVERVRAGMDRARAQGKHVGRPRRPVTDAELVACADLSVREAAGRLGVSKSFVSQWRVSRRAA
jgi:DNA invertase Pin-like site-specific DNA recombinase